MYCQTYGSCYAIRKSYCAYKFRFDDWAFSTHYKKVIRIASLNKRNVQSWLLLKNWNILKRDDLYPLEGLNLYYQFRCNTLLGNLHIWHLNINPDIHNLQGKLAAGLSGLNTSLQRNVLDTVRIVDIVYKNDLHCIQVSIRLC